jgi:hypothetical protein
MTCNGNLREIDGSQDVVMANLLGSGGLQVTVSSKIDPLPPWDSNLRPKISEALCHNYFCGAGCLQKSGAALRLRPGLFTHDSCRFFLQLAGTCTCTAVLRIHDILMWIRVRVRGSMPLAKGFGSGSCYFRHWPSRRQQKTNFLKKFFLLITLWKYIYIIYKR